MHKALSDGAQLTEEVAKEAKEVLTALSQLGKAKISVTTQAACNKKLINGVLRSMDKNLENAMHQGR